MRGGRTMLGCTEPLVSGTGLWVLIALIAGFATGFSIRKDSKNTESGDKNG